MGTYAPERILMPVGLDEAGLKLSLERLPQESLSDYRRRLLLETRDPSDPSGGSVIRHTNRKVGEFETPVFDISLVLDSDDLPVASDPRVVVTSTRLRLYHDYGNRQLDFQVNLVSSRWLVDVVTAFSGSAYFSLTQLEDYSPYLRSDRLRVGDSFKYVAGRALFSSYQNSLPHQNLRETWFSNLATFQDEKATRSEVVESGDFWIDYDQGVIISHDTQSGTVNYEYSEFPYRLYWQPVRVVFANDSDLDYEIKDSLVSDTTGQEEPLLLNSSGARLWNRVLAAHPLGWGE